MIVRNHVESTPVVGPAHGGAGVVRSVSLFERDDFETGLRFIHHTELDPGVSIGLHEHGENEEVYVVLGGSGSMTVNGETARVKRGDVILNKPGWSHGLENDGDDVLEILVFEVDV